MSWSYLKADLANANDPTKEYKRSDYFLCAAIFLLSLFLGWLLSLAYPEGFINAETRSYWLVGKEFKWFAPNALDWTRTIPYGALLIGCSQFEHPSSAVYWINTSMFSLSTALVFVLGRSLFSSSSLGLLLALGALLFEYADLLCELTSHS
jgi:hypothetical protein